MIPKNPPVDESGIKEGRQKPPLSPVGYGIPGEKGPISNQSPDRIGPLSDPQESVWFLEELHPGAGVYNNAYAYRLEGSLDLSTLEKAVNEIIKHHASLRTHYEVIDGQPVQVVHPEGRISIRLIDLSDLTRGNQDTRIDHILSVEPRIPFDLGQMPLLRVIVIRRAPEEHILLNIIHHIITDDWSSGIFNRELGNCYQAFMQGEPSPVMDPEIQYLDHTLRQRELFQGENLQRHVDYWRKKLENIQPLELPVDHPRPPVQSYCGSSIYFDLPPDLVSALRQVGRQENATLFMTTLSAFIILLFRYTNHQDILLGTATASRNRRELESLIGYLVNTVIIRTGLTPGQSFKDIIRSVRRTTLEALMYQELSLERLVKAIKVERDLSRNPLFQVLFIYHNAPFGDLSLYQLKVTRLQIPAESAKVDLSLVLDDESSFLRCQLIYNTDLFERATIERMIAHFTTLLKAIVEDPGGQIDRYPILTQAERVKILEEWQQTSFEYPTGKCLHELVEEQSLANPDHLAVIEGDRQLTYQDLIKQTGRLAGVLRQNGVGPDVLVGLYLERSLELVEASLAVLKAGGAFVPFDPRQPGERLSLMLHDSSPPVMITFRKHLSEFNSGDFKVICLDDGFPEQQTGEIQTATRQPGPGNLAYVIYTSGSTGKPKGVMIEHASITNFVHWWRRVFNITPLDRMAANASPAFDASIWEIYGTLTAGATLIIMPDHIRISTTKLWQWLASHKVSVVWLVTSLAMLALDEDLPPDLQLKFLAVGGELLTSTPQKSLPFPVYNFYGPTESTIVTSMSSVDPTSTRQQSIGHPIDNIQIHILDSNLNPVPVGIAGEICISGAGLARGYLNDSELTAGKFIPNPFSYVSGDRMYKSGDLACYLPDGQIAFLGRMDRQVKIRGYRVDLGEVESALKTHPGIRDVVVVANKDSKGEVGLNAYLIPKPECQIHNEELRHYLAKRIPDYMLPFFYHVMDAFPLTPSGKIDRGALPTQDMGVDKSRVGYTVPITPLEKQLVEIWEKILNVRPVGIEDDFFSLGGHSLIALRLVNLIREKTGLDIPLEVIFQAPTVASQARFLQNTRVTGKWSPLVPIQPKGSRTPFFCISPSVIDVVTYKDLARHLNFDQPFYALYVRKNESPHDPQGKEMSTIDEFIKAIRQIQPRGPYLLGGYSAGGKLAIEMATRLSALGEKVSLVVLFDSFAPGYPRMLPFISPRVFRALRVLRRIESYFWKFWILDWRGKWDLASARHGSLLERFKVWLANRYRELKRPIPPDPFGRITASTVKSSHLTKPYDGDITLIRASQGLLGVRPDHSLGWDKWCSGKLQVIITPGDHEAILFGPRLPAVADILQSCLDSV